MDSFYQKGFLDNSEKKAIHLNKDDSLHFETVLVPDGDFEVIYPQSLSSVGMQMLNSSHMYILPENNFEDSNFREELGVPTNNFFPAEIQDEPSIIGNLHTRESRVNLKLNKDQKCVWANEVPFMPPLAQETTQESYVTPVASLRLLKSKDVIHKENRKMLKLKRKEKILCETLSKIDKEICNMKEAVCNTGLSVNLKTKKQLLGSVINSSVSKKRKEAQKQIYPSELQKSVNKGPNLNDNHDMTSLDTNDKSKECNIDFLKKCIIEASKTLIKTEKSFKILSKLLHTDIFVEKNIAMKHLKDFNYTVNMFRKTVNGLDKKLVTCYRHLVPNIYTNLTENPKSSEDNPGSQKYKHQPIKIIIPAVPLEQIKGVSDKTTGHQDFPSFNACYPSTDEVVQAESEKKREVNKDCPSSKKIKTNIVYRNWRSHLESNSKDSRKVNRTKSTTYVPLSKSKKWDPLIVLD